MGAACGESGGSAVPAGGLRTLRLLPGAGRCARPLDRRRGSRGDASSLHEADADLKAAESDLLGGAGQLASGFLPKRLASSAYPSPPRHGDAERPGVGQVCGAARPGRTCRARPGDRLRGNRARERAGLAVYTRRSRRAIPSSSLHHFRRRRPPRPITAFPPRRITEAPASAASGWAAATARGRDGGKREQEREHPHGGAL